MSGEGLAIFINPRDLIKSSQSPSDDRPPSMPTFIPDIHSCIERATISRCQAYQTKLANSLY